MRRAIPLAALLAAALLLAACSAIRIGYNQADTLLGYKADEYFDLEGVQRDEFARRIERLLAWHRREQLPDYARFLEEAKRRAERGPTRADVEWFVESVKARVRTLAAQGAADAAAMLATVTPDQIRHLQGQWERDNAKFVREHRLKGTREERSRAQVRRTLEQVKDWYGSLTVEQENRITALVTAMPQMAHLRHEDRLRRQREFVALLATRHDPGFESRLRRWLTDWESGRSPEYQRALADAYDRRVAAFLEIHGIMSPAQRARALNRVQDYIDDFNALAAPRVAAR